MLQSAAVKYRQPGYRDSEYKEERERPKSQPRGPREITTREAAMVWRCAECGNQTPVPASVAGDALCSSCGSALHACRNCRHFDTGARYECRQPIPAPVRSKTQANSCTFFAPNAVLDATGRRSTGPSGGRAAFEALFKKK
jgi:predicted RNA-binding Zn-ribbon protein involved in translation (DUF1610 family)